MTDVAIREIERTWESQGDVESGLELDRAWARAGREGQSPARRELLNRLCAALLARALAGLNEMLVEALCRGMGPSDFVLVDSISQDALAEELRASSAALVASYATAASGWVDATNMDWTEPRCKDCRTAKPTRGSERCSRCQRKVWAGAGGSRGRRAQRAGRNPSRSTGKRGRS